MASSSNDINIIIQAKDNASRIINEAAKNIHESTSSGAKSALDNSVAVNKLGDSWLKMGVVAGAVAGTVGTVVNKAISEMTSLVGNAVSRVDTLNNASRTFENMGFAARNTTKMMAALQDSIHGLPTSLDEAVSGVELLAGATNDVELSGKIFAAVNDAVIGFGGSSYQARGAVIQLSQALSNGKVDAQTWNSMIQNGMGPALNALARQMGLTAGALKDGLSTGKISAEEFEKKLVELDTVGGGGMKSLHRVALDATNGIGTGFENAKTAITRGLANIIQAIGASRISNAISSIGTAWEGVLKSVAVFVTNSRPLLDEFTRAITDRFIPAIMPALDGLTKVIREQVAPALIRLWHEVIEPMIPIIGTLLAGAIIAAAQSLTMLFQILAPVINFVVANKDFLAPIIGGFIALKAAMMLQEGFIALQAGFSLLQTVTIPGVMAQFSAMSALIATPIIMPAIAVGAAIASLIAVQDAANKARAAIDGAMQATQQEGDESVALIKDARAKYNRGEISAAKLQQLLKIYSAPVPGHALGTNFAPGGLTMVGENGPELVNLPTGSKVYNARQTQQMVSGGHNAGIHVENYNVYNQMDGMKFLAQMGMRLSLR